MPRLYEEFRGRLPSQDLQPKHLRGFGDRRFGRVDVEDSGVFNEETGHCWETAFEESYDVLIDCHQCVHKFDMRGGCRSFKG